MADHNPILEMKNEPAVTAHINLLQGIMSRLANMSAKCKDWCFAFTGALLVFILSSDSSVNPRLIFIPYAIVGLFYLLDCYYLGLERTMRTQYGAFIDKINELDNITERDSESFGADHLGIAGDIIIKSIYFPYLQPDTLSTAQRCKRQFKSTLSGMTSLSTAIPYGFVLIIVIISNILIATQ